MGGSQSSTQGDLKQRVGQLAASADQGAAAVAQGLGTAAQRATQITNAAGQVVTAAAPAIDAFRLAMANVQKGTVGGAECGDYFGGDETADPAKTLREYEASLAAKAKEDVIRGLARALSRMGIKTDPEGDLDAITATLVAQIPNPKKNKRSFSEDATKQANLCKGLAKTLNDEFTPGASKPSDKFIDTSLGDEAVCRSVGEWVHSFTLGVNTEFLAVHASVRQLLASITILDEIMAQAWAKIQDKVSSSSDETLRRDTEALSELYARAQNERRRQEELLKNILNVQLAPAAKELELALRDESEQNALIKRLGIRPGTVEFGDNLAMAVSGLGTAAAVARRVDKALKQVGFSVRQYLDSKEFSEFQRMLDDKLESGSVDAGEFAKFIQAIEVLRTAFGERGNEAFREALLEDSSSGSMASAAGAGEPRRRRAAKKRGGADEPAAPPSAISRRVELRETEKRVIVRDFAGRMARHYDELLAAVKALGPKLGGQIPLSDQTDALRDALARLMEQRAKAERIELSLIGMYIDAAARERKETFVNTLRAVSASCAQIMELDMYRGAQADFARLKAAIDSIEKTIDQFSDVITKKYGGEPALDADDTAAFSAMYEGGAGETEVALPEIARSGLSLNSAVSEFAYFYYVAKVRANLDNTSKELDGYGEKYEALLGDAVANRLNTLEVARKTILDRLPAAGLTPARLTAVKKWVNDEYNVKAQFYRALQAMDLYMKAFTAAITKDPDAVRDIKKALDGTQVIARWYSDATGDSLWKAFENMGASDTRAVVAPAAAKAVLADATTGHYFQKVATAITAAVNTTLGLPEVGVDAESDQAEAARKNISDALDHFQAFKNLVNAFTRIGDKFGGTELRTKIFMSPSQLYKCLMDYLKQSALSINASGASAAAVPASLAYTVPGGAAPIAAAVTDYQVYFGSVATTGAAPAAQSLTNYAVEDRYFSLIIKAMAAKIFTALGVFDMFERKTPLVDLTPTRMIVGGSEYDEEPEVLEGAAELYFRLTRLGEFYRSFLYWDGDDKEGPLAIAMLPELEGVFAGFIRLIFQKAVGSSLSGEYSDSEIRMLVREVNAVYEHFREKKGSEGGVTSAAILAFVAEINRRYGVIKSADMKAYMKMVKISRTGNYGSLNDTNYAILPGEGESESTRRAPSDTYALPGAAPALPKPFEGREGLDTAWEGKGMRDLLRSFRERLDKKFAESSAELGKISFSLLIKQAEGEIARAQSRSAKFAVATKLILGTSVVGADANKAFMFHETVVVGLNMLTGIHHILSGFSRKIDTMNPHLIENAIMDAIHKSLTAAGGPVAINNKASLLAAIGPNTAVGDGRYIIAESVATFNDRTPVAGVTPRAIYAAIAALPAAPAAGLPNPSTMTDLVAADTDIKLSAGAATPAGAAAYLRHLRTVARLLTDYERIMQDYIEIVFDLSGSNMIEVRFSGGVQFSFAKIRGAAESLLADVKTFFELFRPYIDAKTRTTFEDRTSPGSIFWIEENLVDEFFRGTDALNSNDRILDGVARRASEVFGDLTRETLAQVNNITAAASPAVGTGFPDRYESFGRTLSKIVFYDAVDTVSGQTGLGAAVATTAAGFAMYELILNGRTGSTTPKPIVPGGGQFALFDTAGGMKPYRSLMFAYNQLVARFLTTLSDKAAGWRIYGNLINTFANGVVSRSVMNPTGSSFPDLASAGSVFGRRGDPKPEAILCSSLAWVLQRLIKDVNPNTQVPDHLVATLTDVPLYTKEAMRANLPGFAKLFDLLIQKGDFIKQLMQKTNIRADRPAQAGAGAGAKAVGVTMANYPTGSFDALEDLSDAINSKEMKVRLAGIIDAVANGAYTLSNAASEVLKELGDNPVYLQTGEGSIENYKMRYGKLPLMPLSLSMWYLSSDENSLLPMHSMGTPEFKLLYGTRGLIPKSAPVGFEQMPSVKASLDAFNGVSAKREQIENSRYLRFVQTAVGALRYFTEARNYKRLISTAPTSLTSGGVLIIANPVYPYVRTAQEVLTVVETSNQDDEASKFAGMMGGAMSLAPGSGVKGREKEQIKNLIDMNIIPINVHALIRDIPLANLYNYEYTFEQVIAQMYGLNTDSFKDGATLNNTRQMFLRLLSQPYAEISDKEYGNDNTGDGSTGLVHRIFRGDASLGMGRPKFLSDQIFNKALFGSVYQNSADFDEAGPTAGIGHARGVGPAGPVAAPRNTNITFIGIDTTNKREQVVDVTIPVGLKAELDGLGKARFDTRIVRNLFFITNVVRLLRLKLSRELTQSRNVIESSHMAVASGITEYGSDPFGPNEVLASTLPNGLPRFNDNDSF